MLNRAERERLKRVLPQGSVATKRWLMSLGFSRHFLDNAVKSDLLTPKVPGVYAYYPGNNVSWQGVVSSLQKMEGSPVHVGGLTALEFEGISHYANLSSRPPVYLYGPPPFPDWPSRLNVAAHLVFKSTRRLFSDVFLNNEKNLYRSKEWRDDAPPLLYACPELAYLETLCDLGAGVTFEHADELMQGAVNFSPRKLNGLLQSCKHVKVKRAFLFFAARHKHSWFDLLDMDEYDLGEGKREIFKGGVLDKEMQITVPKELKLS